MKIGIFAKTFVRPSLEATLDAVRAHELDCVQFNLACAGLPTLPDALEPATVEHIRAALAARGLQMAAISGTFNMAHPDPAERAKPGRLARPGGACAGLGTRSSRCAPARATQRTCGAATPTTTRPTPGAT